MYKFHANKVQQMGRRMVFRVIALPTSYPEESLLGLVAPLIVKGLKTDRVACGLGKFDMIPVCATASKIVRYTYNAHCESAADKPS
jgi:hypothetical protein